jgi:hypothetical protein
MYLEVLATSAQVETNNGSLQLGFTTLEWKILNYFWICSLWVEKKREKSLLISGIKPRPSSQQPVTLLTEFHQLRKYTSNSLEIVIDVGVETGDIFHKGSVI